MTDSELIRAAIAAGGLSSRRFAEDLMGRDGRTIRRWITGEISIPPLAKAWLGRWLALPPATQATIREALVQRPQPTGQHPGPFPAHQIQ